VRRSSNVVLVDSHRGGDRRAGRGYLFNLRRLLVDGEEAVKHTHPAGAREFDRQFRLRDGVHRRRDERRR